MKGIATVAAIDADAHKSVSQVLCDSSTKKERYFLCDFFLRLTKDASSVIEMFFFLIGLWRQGFPNY